MELSSQFDNIAFQHSPASGSNRYATMSAMYTGPGEHQGKSIANLTYHEGNGTIKSAYTHEDFQGKGIATSMAREVAENHMPTFPNGRRMMLKHSDNRTFAGDKFAKATSDFTDVPKNRNARKGQKYLKGV